MKFVVCPSRSRGEILKKTHRSGLCSNESTITFVWLFFGGQLQCLFAAITFTRLCMFMMD
jgi:hypothetical protein